MRNNNRTKRALVGSIISMILSFIMLLGTTFAWYTDSVSSGVNRIQAGNLDIDLMYYNPALTAGDKFDSVDGNSSIFQIVENNQWEPGGFVYAKLRVKNSGSLALKYTLDLLPSNFPSAEEISLVDVVKVYECNSNIQTDTESVRNAISSLTPTTIAGYTKSNSLLGKGESNEFAIVLHWPSSTYDNRLNPLGEPPSPQLGIRLIAHQATKESDSFDETYDEWAQHQETVTETVTAGEDTILQGDSIKATIPADAVSGEIQVKLVKEMVSTPANITVAAGAQTMTYEIKLVNNVTEEAVTLNAGNEMTVELQIGEGITDSIQLYHDSTPIDSTYNQTTGILTFTTSSFSPFTVVLSSKPAATSKEFLAALGDSKVRSITISNDIEFDWGEQSYGNSGALILQGKTVIGATGKESITFKGYGSANPIKNVTLKNLTVKDETVGDNENSWEHGYLEFENLTASNVTFFDQPQLNGICKLTDCTFNGTADQYAAWINSGEITLNGCTFIGGRSLKLHEVYGSEITSVVIDGCTFKTNAKPGVVIGTLNADTAVTIKNSTFDHCAAGDQSMYIYESDTAVETFTFAEKNNKVNND